MSCPACLNATFDRVRTVSAREAAQHFVLREADPLRHVELHHLIEKLWDGPNCDLRRCGLCGFVHAAPFISGDERFYNLAYGETKYPRRRWEFDRTVAALDEMKTSYDDRVVEIGAGHGHFLDLAVRRFFWNPVAVEHNESSRRVLEAKLYSVVDDLRSLGSVHHVFMFQVLEHMDDLDARFAEIRRITAPSANVFVAVPNAERIERNERWGNLLDMPPNHIGRWTVAAMELFAKRNGFYVQAHAREPASLGSFVVQDAISAHLRKAQRSGTLANWARTMRRGRARSATEAALVAASLPSRLPAIFAALPRLGSLGESLWFHLRRRS